MKYKALCLSIEADIGANFGGASAAFTIIFHRNHIFSKNKA